MLHLVHKIHVRRLNIANASILTISHHQISTSLVHTTCGFCFKGSIWVSLSNTDTGLKTGKKNYQFLKKNCHKHLRVRKNFARFHAAYVDTGLVPVSFKHCTQSICRNSNMSFRLQAIAPDTIQYSHFYNMQNEHIYR
jgi:hypothetical protein